jgi:hypothetical protein
MCQKQTLARAKGTSPGAKHWQNSFESLIVDFTKMLQAKGCKYLLVFVCTFSGWMKALPTWTKKAQEVSRCLLKEIFLQFKITMSAVVVGDFNIPLSPIDR